MVSWQSPSLSSSHTQKAKSIPWRKICSHQTELPWFCPCSPWWKSSLICVHHNGIRLQDAHSPVHLHVIIISRHMSYNTVSINEMCNGHILQINIQSYELQNNKWQASVVHINKTWCQFIVDDPYFMESIIRQSNYPDKCPIKAVSSPICYPHFISVYRLSAKFVATQLARDSWLRNR